MTGAIFAIVSVNALLFTILGMWSVRNALRDPLPRMRAISWALAAVAGAFVLGALTRLALLAAQQGWLPAGVGTVLSSEWHLLQSLAATALGVGGVLLIRRLGPEMRRSEKIVSALSDTFATDAPITAYGLTERELEVAALVGTGAMSDKAIAEALFISPATAATHIRNILRKTGLGSRRDLLLLVAASRDETEHSAEPPGVTSTDR